MDSERCTYCGTKGALFKLFCMRYLPGWSIFCFIQAHTVDGYSFTQLLVVNLPHCPLSRPRLPTPVLQALVQPRAVQAEVESSLHRWWQDLTLVLELTYIFAIPVRATSLWISPCQDAAVCFIKHMGRMMMYGMGDGAREGMGWATVYAADAMMDDGPGRPGQSGDPRSPGRTPPSLPRGRWKAYVIELHFVEEPWWLTFAGELQDPLWDVDTGGGAARSRWDRGHLKEQDFTFGMTSNDEAKQLSHSQMSSSTGSHWQYSTQGSPSVLVSSRCLQCCHCHIGNQLDVTLSAFKTRLRGMSLLVIKTSVAM
ncbi:hypothetical protein K439DRAFT_1619798 [Ramaria rubella]|nr:hypothetical protein K439DRAFT_1619798 [Ramaria rubella]